MAVVKDRKEDFSRQTIAIEFFSRGERVDSTLNTTRTSGYLQSRNRAGMYGWKIAKSPGDPH